jgi:hypothetical protein
MTKRLFQPVPWKAAVVTIGSTLAVAGLTGAVRLVAQSKLDTSRFVADSITTHFERKEDRSLLYRIDSTVQLVCAKTNCRSFR